MERNRQRVIDFYNKHKGELLLSNGSDVKRLIALCEDDSDYYYVMYDPFTSKISYMTAVARNVVLKGKISDDDYNFMDSQAKMNDIYFKVGEVAVKKALDKLYKNFYDNSKFMVDEIYFSDEIFINKI